VIPYVEIIAQSEEEARRLRRRQRSRVASKTTYVCPNHQNVRAWGKPGLPLQCGVCEAGLEAIGFTGGEEFPGWEPDG
jgi:hypothetical protein